MAPLVCFGTSKIHHRHQLKNGFVTMDKNLDETTEDGLCFYLHSNQLADQPILLFPSGMEKLICALPKVYEFYDSEVWAKAAAKSDGVQAVNDKVIFSVNIATTPPPQELQTNLEISVCRGETVSYTHLTLPTNREV